jgi:alpha-mannosidase
MGHRRRFLSLAASALALAFAGSTAARAAEAGPPPRAVHVVPNFHPACCGWLTDFSTERNYCANSYLDHLDRVRDDPTYSFALSEVPNMIAMLEFEPARAAELRARIREGRVELVNAFFLEPDNNLSGGEALVKSGVEGLRWQMKVLGRRPRFAWMIDVTGSHEQMAQIVAGLGLEAMIYCRHNPTASSIHWLESPDGTRALAICPGGYADWGSLFASREPLSRAQLDELAKDIGARAASSPAGAPVLVLGGNGDYNLAPLRKENPREFLEAWKSFDQRTEVRISTPTRYLDAVLPGIQSGAVQLPTHRGGTAYSFNSFWIQSPTVKGWYRRAEHGLQAAEALAAIASLSARFDYPVEPLHHAWLQMLLNMDRNTIWGAAGGMVFEDEKSWDVADRFESVEAISSKTLAGAMGALLARPPEAGRISLFNPLNWKRSDPFVLQLPGGRAPAGAASQSAGDGAVLCRIDLPSTGVLGVGLEARPAEAPEAIDFQGEVETSFYRARIDLETGALASLRLKPSGREVLGGPANVLVAERAVRQDGDPGDFTPDRPGRKRLATSSEKKPRITATAGTLATVVEVRSEFLSLPAGECIRTYRFYRDHPRIDLQTMLKDIPDRTVVVAEFPLAAEIVEARRGIPYGFSHAAVSRPDPQLHGFLSGITPAVRWSHYSLASGGGVAILDRGLPGRELDGKTPLLFLLNATDTYYGYPNKWLSGRGKRTLEYALLAQEADWPAARVPQMAWEFNCPPFVVPGGEPGGGRSFLETSGNVIVEALRREGGDIELRLAECLGIAGSAEVNLALPHGAAFRTDLVGGRPSPLEGGPAYRFPVRPQEIVTIRLRAPSPVEEPRPLLSWAELVPERKREALSRRILNKGHPPRGNEPRADIPRLPERTSLATGRKATASNVYRGLAEYGPDRAVDGEARTRWATDDEVREAWLEVDLGAPASISGAFLSEAYDRVTEFELQARTGGGWTTFARGGKIGVGLDLRFAPVNAREVRLAIHKATGGPTIWEFMLFEAGKEPGGAHP